ncbi:MAG: thiol:disulfide interchange protein, partial [Verrucomicrobiae bacterium]|nr:thiol:disulfide interchange protein [Verrucomicrobiae bacterium]
MAEHSAIQPGVPFKVGLKMNHAAGQHTYWKHPGIVGVPTKLDWKLPKGFVAGEIEWPRPELTMMAIYPVYGYENQILLPVSITPPASLDPKTDREGTPEAA